MTPDALRQNREFKALEVHLRDIQTQGYRNVEIIVGDHGWPVITFINRGKRYYYHRDADLFVSSRADACAAAQQPERHRSSTSSYRHPSGMEPNEVEQGVTEAELSEVTQELRPPADAKTKKAWWRSAYPPNPLTPPSAATLKKYNLTADNYVRMLVEQDYKCAICRRPPKVRRLNIDHCHKKGHVRGLLCYSCNYGLGVFRDAISSFENAVIYLKKNQR